jgi:hypothetical protein
MANNNIALKTDVLKEIVKAYEKDLPIAIGSDKSTVIEFSDANKDLLEWLQDNIQLTAAQNNALNKWLMPDAPKTLKDVKADSVSDFFRKISTINSSADPMVEVQIANKWYPIKATAQKFKFRDSFMIEFKVNGKLGDLDYDRRMIIGPWNFEDEFGLASEKTFDEIMGKRGIRATTPEVVEKAKKWNMDVVSFNTRENQVYDSWGVGLVYHEWWGFQEVNIGWKDSPAMVVVEPTLENENADDDNVHTAGEEWHLPFVRVFSMAHKAYVYVDIESMKTHVYVRDGKDKIVLPKKMMMALESIFNAKKENIFGDLFHGRHGGIVVLANGPSGVGKTLTAEVFAEYQERPLYTMEMSEVGTSVEQVEANLQKIFARAKKWNAVLLFDEADIFLSERVASDLERSAIVGIFLRLLDYYEGTFFLTTNRGDGIDKAFKSRVTLYLNYPELSPETRKVIWQSMLKSAGMEVHQDVPWSTVADARLNGRQIRNQVRLLKLMYPDGKITTGNLVESLEFAAT